MNLKTLNQKFFLTVMALAMTVIAYGFQTGTPSISKKFTVNGTSNLEVRTSGGKIKVEGQNGNEVEIQAFVKKRGETLAPNDEEVKNIDDYFEFEISQSGSDIIASAKRLNQNSGWTKNSLSVSFVAYVPHNMVCDLNTSGGSIAISAIHNKLNAKTSGGSIKVKDQNGDMELHTSGGSINISDAKGNVDAHTSGGSINLDNIAGYANVRTSGGGININGQAEFVKASTSGGRIKVDITGLNKSLDLSTSGGSIYASIPKGLGLDLNLRAHDVDINLENFSGTAKKDRIEGRMNGGGIPVKMRTSGGGIDVVFN